MQYRHFLVGSVHFSPGCVLLHLHPSINPSYVMYSLVRSPVYQQADTERQTYGPFRIINCPNMHVRLDCGRKTGNPDETGHMVNMQAQCRKFQLAGECKKMFFHIESCKKYTIFF